MPVLEAALANIETTLEAATVGGDAMSSASVVRIRPPADPTFDELLDDSLDTQIFIEQGDTSYETEAHNADQTSNPLQVGVAEVFILVVVKYQADNQPRTRTSGPDALINNAVDDVISSLLTTRYRGGNARDTRLTNDGPLDAGEAGTFWIAEELRFEIDFEFPEDAP